MDDSVTHFPVQTSGSTGAPKLIQHSRAAMTASAERTCDFLGLKKCDVALLALPATHIGGKMMIVRSIVRGMKLICTEPKSNPLVSLDFDGDIGFTAFTPMQMSMIMDDANTNSKLLQIKKIILGGGEVPYPLRMRLQGIRASVYETYGMTETVSHIALKKINGDDRSEYFHILDGVKIAIDDRGCLIIDAPHLSADRLVTNDIVNIISDKEFQWLGRYDNVINTGGIKVSAEEIERKLQPYVDLKFFIAGIADDILGQRVVMIVETIKSKEVIQQRFEDVLSIYLSKYEKPKEILTIEKFSYTENGKVNKKQTLARLSQ
jgi:O-succinylbenzoic acid--CoA ligase